ncbi:FAD/NAD(P)-binding protein [Demequina activiva]|uniref:FAD-dependent urate hydroxylase HpyO/Asp monooxygenase CreE-like FAD/NAD(P)-binding domain-containing protein n=1 Tax=Demequina activiva TaxID=1582364 RepID=A0A919UK54_9MICO|nr:FAD/NAD(P)-binding domain-containing protein [Demequina activiva]GIG53368.1 hypothetical protein Dac01nite_01200 [Demequina activiva]
MTGSTGAFAPDHGTDLVIVGGGPRAVYALADLETALLRGPSSGRQPLRVTVLEPGEPGAGAVWDPRQPEHLLMNVDARIVDATCPSVDLTMNQWRRAHPASDPYPPRAEAGRYLVWAFRRLATSPVLEVRHRAVRATTLTREGDAWRCDTVDASGEPSVPARAPRVLLATGHAGGAGVDHRAIADAGSGPAPGSPVVVRGAALTAFDVVMDLTAGREGRWVESSATLSGLEYVASGHEPSSITLVSRTGEPMLPKPARASAAVTDAVRERTAAWAPDAVPDDDWWDVLLDAGVAAARASGIAVTVDALRERLDTPVSEGPERWARDIRRARGDVDGDPAWWLGRAWSAGYADVVRSLDRAPRDCATWTRWRARAAALERWAFGPPLVTHTRLLALREAGILRVETGASALEDLDGTTVIDAFTRGPGVLDAPRAWSDGDGPAKSGRAPWDGLLRSGAVTVRAGERGVLTAHDGACVGADGTRTPGLSALGRPTEDAVIGHDSLQRRLHRDSRRWAHALAQEWQAAQDARALGREPVHG